MIPREKPTRMQLTEQDIRRRRDAKRFNEHLKLAANTLNSGGLLILVGAVGIPSLRPEATQIPWVWFPTAVAIHIGAQFVLNFLVSED